MTSARERETLLAEDAATRERAQRVFDRPLVVEAGAGTGKTNILIARIVVWSLGPGWKLAAERVAASARGEGAGEDGIAVDRIAAQVMGRIAAITFTEAAAAEMARRVGKALNEIADGDTPRGVLESVLPPEAAERRLRARALIGALDHLLVRTIHAFCRGLLAQYPLEAGVHPGFQVDAEGLLQAEIVREVVEASVGVAYADANESDLLRLAMDGIGPAQIEESVATLVASGVSPGVFDADPFPPDRIAQVVAGLAAAAAGFQRVDSGRLAVAKKTPTAPITCEAVENTRLLAEPAGIASVADLEGFAREAEAIWQEKPLARLKKWARGDFTGGELAAIDGEAEAIAEVAAPLYERCVQVCALSPEFLDCARRALQPLLRSAREELRRRGAATFGSLLRDTRDLLVDNPDVRRRVRGELELLLVDEFQDTDPLQCEIIRAIAFSGPREQRPSLFLVGDPKQSIYGWRNADLRAYDDFVNEVVGDGERDRLVHNFRSLPDVLEAVQQTIAPVMRREQGIQPAFQTLVSEREAVGEAAAVEHWVSWEMDGEGEPRSPNAAAAATLEARAIATDIRRRVLDGEVTWGEVGILFRSTGDLEIYLQELRALDVPYAVERDRGYYRRREIIEASALVRCVLDRNDQLALVAWLRSAAVGLPDAALLPLWKREFPSLVSALQGVDSAALERLEERVDAAAAEVPRDVPGIERIAGWDASLRHALRVVAALRASFEEDVSDVFVEKLRTLSLLEAGEASRYLGPYRAANLDRFFRDLSAELEADCDRETLLRRLRTGVMEAHEAEEARPRSAEEAVRIMTIHKAKGLDFEHTYLVQLHKTSGGRRGGAAPAEVDFVGERAEFQLFGAPSLNFDAVLAQRARVEAAERIRTLYVAMTRAKNRLVLVGNWPVEPRDVAPEAASSFLDLLARRSPGVPELTEVMRDLAAAGSHAVTNAGALWVFPSLRPTADPAREPRKQRPEPPALESRRRAANDLCGKRRAAEERSQRPWNTAPSVDSHAEEHEEQARRRFGEEESYPDLAASSSAAADGAAARVAGTVVHRILEDFDLAADPAAELARQSERAARLVAALAGENDRPAAAERVAVALAALGRGRLLRRLRDLAGDVVSRELPVLLPPSDGADGAVGFVAGSIDLVYRDPASGDWVVVDYKTDRVRDDAEIAERVARYAGQGRAYQRAVRDALGLEEMPRFELWFIDADRLEVVA